MTKQQILDKYPDEEFLFADGFDDCIIGIDSVTCNVCYDVNKCIDNLISQGMQRGEAVEYLYFNSIHAYVGDKTPYWIETE